MTVARHRRAGEADYSQARRDNYISMCVRPKLARTRLGAIIEFTVCAVVAGHGLPEIIGTLLIRWLTRLLRFVSGPRKITVRQARREFVAFDRSHGRPSNKDLGAIMMRRPMNRVGSDLRLENRRHRLRLSRQPAFHP